MTVRVDAPESSPVQSLPGPVHSTRSTRPCTSETPSPTRQKNPTCSSVKGGRLVSRTQNHGPLIPKSGAACAVSEPWGSLELPPRPSAAGSSQRMPSHLAHTTPASQYLCFTSCAEEGSAQQVACMRTASLSTISYGASTVYWVFTFGGTALQLQPATRGAVGRHRWSGCFRRHC